MKKLLLILFLVLSISAIGQSKYSYKRGLKFLSKSQELYKNNEFEKSLYYLNKYENSVLAYCGNGYVMAKMEIYDLKMKNYLGSKNFDNALNLIDNNEESAYNQFYDSLKVEILFLKYGKEKVIESFSNSNVTNRSSEIINYNYSIDLKDLDYNFKFIVSDNDHFDKKIFLQNDFQNFYFISYNQPIHKLIFNNNKEKVPFRHIRTDGNNLKINFESKIDNAEFNKLNKKQQDIVDKYILYRNPKIISATTDETFHFSKKDKYGKLLNEYSREIKVYINYLENKVDNYKIEIIDYNNGKQIPLILETITFSTTEFETKKIELKELNIDLKAYLNNINLDIEKSILENYPTE